MNLFLSTCPVCGKDKGRINGVNHARCSKQMQQLSADKKRPAAAAKLPTKRGVSFANLILRTTA